MQTREQGYLGESLAQSWMQHQGYRFIERNFYRRVGEIDLIFQHPDEHSIVFVEVRYRANQQFGGGIVSVNWKKQRKLLRTADAWLQLHTSSRVPARIDIIGIRPADAETPTACMWQDHEITWVVNALEQ